MSIWLLLVGVVVEMEMCLVGEVPVVIAQAQDYPLPQELITR